MITREIVTEVAVDFSWQLGEQAERTGTLGALDEWWKDGNVVRVFYKANRAIRTGWRREGNRDWFRITGQDKGKKIIRYLKTGYDS